MAEQPPNVEFEEIPLEEARRMGRGPRMEHMLYDTLTKKIQALSADAVRVRLGPEIRPERMRRYIQRMAHELGIPVTIRRVEGGVIFWRATEEDLQQAQHVTSRLQRARQQPKTQSRGRQRRRTRRGRGRRV